MNWDEPFRRPGNSRELIDAIQRMELPPVRLMEVCGTHTMAIAKAGLKELLPEQVQLISGPGCPVCVTPAGVMDEVLRLSALPNVVIASYGDLLRVPGSIPGDNLRRRKALGAEVRMVYSPMDCLAMAQQEPEREIIFLGVGFETTAPGTAIAVLEAKRLGIRNFSVLCLLKRTEPALRAILESPDCRVDGFLCPGHVATILGADAFRFLPEEYGVPGVVAGFEAGDLLTSVYLLLAMLRDKMPQLRNEYTRAVMPEGNPAAKAMLEAAFCQTDDVWRGLGEIPMSGYRLREEYRAWDAGVRFGFAPKNKETVTACKCGEIIRGIRMPMQCPMFGKTCTPENPVGPCMVSSEGACAAAYKYQR